MHKNKFLQIRAIFFDVGDTLYTNDALEKEYPMQLHTLITQTKHITIDQAKTLLKETTERLKQTEKHVTKVRAMSELGFTRQQVHEAFCKVNPSQFLTKDPGLKMLITSLAHRYQLGIISNFKKSHTEEILYALGLSKKQFPLFVTEDIVQEIKPAHEPFQKAVELSGLAANECVYVGDSPSKDMRPAKEVGMMTILVKENPTPEDMTYADAAINSIKELSTLL